MRKRIAAKSTRIPPVKLYWEDLSELVSLFKEYCENVEVSDDKAIYESLGEASEKITSAVTNLEIVGKNPSIKLSLKSNGSWLTQVLDKPEMAQKELDQLDLLFIRVKDFLGERRRPVSYLFPLVTLIVMLISFVAVGALAIRKHGVYGDFLAVGAWGLVCAWLMGTRELQKDIGTVSLKPKASATSFWSRNKDDMAMLVIGALVGIFGTLLADWIKSYIQKK